jgi:hypothetical protein
MQDFTRVSIVHMDIPNFANFNPGIAPKVSQSVMTAAFLFAFKDVLYEQTIRLRRSIPAKIAAK